MVLLLAAGLLAGCQKGASASENAPTVETATAQYADPPQTSSGISVEQAYEAIPHPRTVWDAADTTVPREERAYLSAIFKVLDEAVAVRVAGMQDYSSGHFNYSDPEAEYGRLLAYVQEMAVPTPLAEYHQDIIAALTGQQKFFADWKAQGQNFAYAQNVGVHPGVQGASAALRAAYNELMAKYPHEAQKNKDAFFDYHCALDFM